MIKTDLYKTYLAGQVTRYHSNPEFNKLGQTNADHTAGMLSLLYKLHDDPPNVLVKAIVYHDSPEFWGGDLSYSFKQAHPELAERHEAVSKEMAYKDGLKVPTLIFANKNWLELVDRLESCLYAKTYRPDVFQEEDWLKLRHRCLVMAMDLGCYSDELALTLGLEPYERGRDLGRGH